MACGWEGCTPQGGGLLLYLIVWPDRCIECDLRQRVHRACRCLQLRHRQRQSRDLARGTAAEERSEAGTAVVRESRSRPKHVYVW